MKVLVLILASDSDDFNQFQKLWRKYMNLDQTFECYFVKANPNISEDVIKENDTIFVKTVLPLLY